MKKLTTKRHWEIPYQSFGKSSDQLGFLKKTLLWGLKVSVRQRSNATIEDFSQNILRNSFLKNFYNSNQF